MYLDRRNTRDLLLEYDRTVVPPRPRQAGLLSVYPWEHAALAVFADQLYQIAANSGFAAGKDEFLNNFGSYLEGKPIIYSNFIDFPETGEIGKLYFATDEKILYYWDSTEYKPVKATLIDNTILYSGDASEYYDA